MGDVLGQGVIAMSLIFQNLPYLPIIASFMKILGWGGGGGGKGGGGGTTCNV